MNKLIIYQLREEYYEGFKEKKGRDLLKILILLIFASTEI